MLLASAAVSGLSLPAFAADKWWDISATAGLQPGSGTWDTSASTWSTLVAGTALTSWESGDNAQFTVGPNVVTLDGTIIANSITVSGSAAQTTLNGGTLQLTGTGVVMTVNSSASLTVNSNVIVGGTLQTWTVNPLTVNGSVSGSGNGINFGATSRAVFNGNVNLGGMTISASSGSPSFVTLGAPSTFTTLSTGGAGGRLFAGADLTMGALVPAGAATALGGNNTLTGITPEISVASGLVIVERDANLGGTGVILDFGNGGTLRIVGTAMTSWGARTVTYGGTNGDDPVLDLADPNAVFTYNKNITINSASQFVKAGAGKLIMNQAYTSTGTYNARGGILQLDANGGSLPTAAKLSVSGGTFVLSGATGANTVQTVASLGVGQYGGTISVSSDAALSTTLNLGAITATTASGALNIVAGSNTTVTTSSGVNSTGIYSGRILYNGADWAATDGAKIAAYTGYTGLDLSAGTDTANSLVTASGALLGSRTTNTLKIANAATGTLDNTGASLSLTGGALLFTGSADFNVNGGTMTSGLLSPTASDLVIHQNGSGTLTIGTTIANGTGVSTLTKAGTGKLVLTAINAYTGETNINGGTLSGSDLSGTTSNISATAASSINVNGGVLEYTGANDTIAHPLSIGNNGATVDITGSGVLLTITGAISNTSASGSLTKAGAGTLVLATASNSWTGGLTIKQGVLQTNAVGSLNSNFPNIVSFSAGSTGILRTNGQNIAVAGLSTDAGDAGTTFVENNSATNNTLTVNSVFATKYAGTIRNGSTGTLGLTKIGGNSLTLSGTNTYTGATSVLSGKLIVNGSITGSNVAVGSTGVLAGIGGVSNAVTTSLKGGISPGDGGAGTLTVGSLDVAAGGRLILDIGAASGGSSSDQIVVTNALTASTAENGSVLLELSNTGNAVTFTPYTIATFTGAPNLTDGDFTPILSNLTLDTAFDGDGILINGNSVQVQFMAVPEPGALSILGLGLAGLLKRRRAR